MDNAISPPPAAATAAVPPDAATAIMPRPTFDASTGTIEIPTPYAGGFLSFTPDQKIISKEQLVVLSPLGIQANWSVPHVIAFLAECHARGLDAWSREAFLMRYPGDKYVRHIGIAGMRRHANATGEYRGRSQILYCGDDGRMVKVWPYKDRVPYAAEVTAHRVGWEPTVVVALYDEYCPLEEHKERKLVDGEWRRVATGRGKVPVPMWTPAAEGGKPTVMLGKCAEAAALRAAFPRQFNGWYAPEEFHRAATEMAELHDERATARREAYAAANGAGPIVDAGDVGVEVVDTTAAAAAQPAADAGDEQTPSYTAEQARALLLGELDAQARLLGRDRAWMVSKWQAARDGRDFTTAATLAEVGDHVRRFRVYLTGVLRKRNLHELADRYAAAPMVGDLQALFGTDTPWEQALAGAGVKTAAGAAAVDTEAAA